METPLTAEEGRSRPWARLGAAVLVLALCRLLIAAALPVLEAEAYYWCWSRDLAPGYVDHPPAIAFVIRAGEMLVGHSRLGTRSGSVLLGVLALLLFSRIARRVAGDRAALPGVLFYGLAPFAFPFAVLAPPEAPLLFVWTRSLWAFLRAWETGRAAWWLAAGAATGATILSKYNGFQLPLAFAVFLLLAPRGRGWLRRWPPYAALGVALLLALPNLAWNARHGASTLATPFRNGLDIAAAPVNVLAFLALPFVLLTPWPAWTWLRSVAEGIASGRTRREDAALLCACVSLVPLAAFAALSPFTLIHAHWPAPCMVGAAALLARTWTPDAEGRRRRRRHLVSAAAFAAAGLLLASVPMAMVFHGPQALARPSARVASELLGQRELGERLRQEIAAHGPDGLFLSARSHHVAGLLSWLVAGRVPTVPLQVHRLRQFGVGLDWRRYRGWNAVYVNKEPGEPLEEWLLCAFERVRRLPPLVVRAGATEVRRFELYLCEGFVAPL